MAIPAPAGPDATPRRPEPMPLVPAADPAVRPRVLAAVLAALLAVTTQVAGMKLASVFPFGKRPWAVNDAYHQLLPHRAYIREVLLHPGGPDSLLFNWHSALGMPYLADFATYAASPFNLLLVFVPRDRLTIGVLVITMVQVAVAAAAMALVLMSLHRRAPWGVAAALAAGYAGCGWVTGDAMVVLSWMDGLVAFPVLLWCALQLIRRRRLVPAVLLVALFWMANYYTAVMATLGIGLVVLALLVITGTPLGEALRALARVVGGFALGIAMISWLVLPVLTAVRSAAQVPGAALYQFPWATTLARLFPGNWTLGSAGLFVGVATLALVAAVPWNGRLTTRSRIALPVLVVGSLVSIQVPATQLVWHSMAVPNGSAYREAFAIAGILVVTAWLGLADGLPGRRALIAGAVTVAVLGAVLFSRLSAITLGLTAATVALLIAAAVLGARRWLALVMLVTLAAESTYMAGETYRAKAKYHGAPTTLSAAAYAARLAEVPRVPDGERTRVAGSSDNDPLLLGFNGVDYYSSTIPQTTTDALSGLGLPSVRRRVGFHSDDPGARALLGIHDSATDPANAIVTVVPTASAPASPSGSVFAHRNLLAGTDVYALPALRITDPATGQVADDTPVASSAPAALQVSARCAPGATLQVLTRTGTSPASGTIEWQGRSYAWNTEQVYTLGAVPADGQINLTVHGSRLDLRPGDIGCLDRTALDRTTTNSRAQNATTHFGKERITVTWPTAQTGDAVILTTALPGWTCTTDTGPATPTSRAGMLTVPIQNATSLTCHYATPGLRTGIAVSLGALALTFALQLLRIRRRRRLG